MKVVIAPDKFKGSITGIEFCDLVEKGMQSVNSNISIAKIPLADGGDGTIEILDYHLTGQHINSMVNDPLFRPIEASYFYMPSIRTAFIEMAEASGMKLLAKEDQNCINTTTFGTGEQIISAIKNGAKTIVVGIGGSATNECGIGMAAALGYKFLDKFGKEVNPVGKNLNAIETIDTTSVIKELKDIEFKVACDVTNPLYGKNGAAYVYASQKGASKSEITVLDKGLRNLANIIQELYGINVQNIKGGGAAGGMGVGTRIFLDASLNSGIDLIKDLIEFDNLIKKADWIITGEGKLDDQTLSGKTIKGVMDSAQKHQIKVAAFCGISELNEEELKNLGISYIDQVMNYANDLDDAIENANKYLETIARRFTKSLI